MTSEDIAKPRANDLGTSPGIGSIVESKGVARDRSSLYIDLGNQGTGIIFGREFYEVKELIKTLQIGDTVHAKIVELENEDGYRELSLQDATKDLSWQKLREMKDSAEIIKVKILKELQKFIGKTLEVKVLDLLAEENKLILSEKAKTEQAIKKILDQYKKGDIIEGKITGIADFGAFIRFPLPEETAQNSTETNAEPSGSGSKNSSIEGLIHISELDWQLAQNPAEVVKVGEVIKAQIIDINNNQVFLSLKSLKENPWEKIEKDYKKGDKIQGKVISFSPFGAFVEVLPKIRGLCHISEFSSQKEMEESLKAGETYKFEILLIEPKEHRMSLKLAK